MAALCFTLQFDGVAAFYLRVILGSIRAGSWGRRGFARVHLAVDSDKSDRTVKYSCFVCGFSMQSVRCLASSGRNPNV